MKWKRKEMEWWTKGMKFKEEKRINGREGKKAA